jgi:hypothetical protein
MPRPYHRPLLLTGLACLALGSAFPFLIRKGIVPAGPGDTLHGFVLGIAIGLMLLSLRRGRATRA